MISTPIGFLGSGKGGGVELTLNSLVSGLLSLGHSVEVIAPKNSKLYESNKKFTNLIKNSQSMVLKITKVMELNSIIVRSRLMDIRLFIEEHLKES